MIKTIDQWINYANQHRRCFFFYEEKALDLTEFILQHPGGKKAMTNYINKDITQILFKVFPHKKEYTLKILFNYSVGTIKDKTNQKKSNETLPIRSQTFKSKKKVCFQKKFICDDENQGKSSGSEYTDNRKSEVSKKKSVNSMTSNSKSQRNLGSGKKSKKSSDNVSHTSIKTLQQKPFQQDKKSESPRKNKKKHRTQKENIVNSNIGEEELDEKKLLFHVPILNVKHMNQI